MRDRPASVAGVDGLAALLAGTRARGAFLLRCQLEPPFSLRLEDGSPLSLVVVERGPVWVQADAAPPVQVRPGDVVVRVGPAPWRLGDDPATPDQLVVGPGQVCRAPDGRPLGGALDRGPRRWGTGGDDAGCRLLSGVYQVAGEVPVHLLRTLPGLLVVRAADLASPLPGLLASEVLRDAAGQEVVLDRLLDALLVTVLRSWLDRAGRAAPGWYAGRADPVVGPALAWLHDDPAHPWTVAALAARSGVSRSVLARRFTDVVGVAPISYLTEWRLTLAAELLAQDDLTVAAVAHRVGYGSAFALSTAFRRHHGASPQQWRRAVGRGLERAAPA